MLSEVERLNTMLVSKELEAIEGVKSERREESKREEREESKRGLLRS